MDRFSALCSGKYYVIPANQRGFSWDKSHIDDVFRDIAIAGTQAHYLGPLIVSRDSAEPDFQTDDRTTTSRYILEDGQQRFTTFLLILNAIKLALETKFQGGPNMESQMLEKVVAYQYQGRHLRLQNLNPNLDSCLQTIFNGQPPWPDKLSPPMVALKAAATHIEKRVANYSLEELVDWSNRFLNQAVFVFVDLAAGINRYLAFDAINSRGLPLSEFDKIKNFCILVNEQRRLGMVPEDEWYISIEHLQSFSVGSRSLEEACISELYSAYHDQSVSRSNVHNNFVHEYRSLLDQSDANKEKDFKDFVDFWDGWSHSFGFITSPERNQKHGSLCTAKAGSWLDRLDNMELPTICRILLVACHMKMTESEFESVARGCEIYTFRVYCAGPYRSDKNSKAIINLAQEVLRLGRDARYVLNRICTWLEDLAPLQSLISTLGSGDVKYYHDRAYRGWQHTYYFLYEYELFLSPTGVAPLPWAKNKDEKINTQEHILPQKHRDNGWWEGVWSNEEAEDFKHRLGNLVLTTGNSTLGRKEFAKKLDDPDADYCYSYRSSTNSEKAIVNFTDGTKWDPECILKREHSMLEFAAKRWSLPCCSDNGEINLPDDFHPLGLTEIPIFDNDCFEEIDENDVEVFEETEDGEY